MTTNVLEKSLSWPDNAVRGAGHEVLGAILMPDVNLAVWESDDLPPVPHDLGAIDNIRIPVALESAEATISEALVAARYPSALIAGWTAMVARHAKLLGNLLDCTNVVVRLKVVETDACCKFHADYVSVRLIATFTGPGTQWLDAGDAVRLHAGAEVEKLSVRNIATGHIALFKGHDWAPERAIVHRSPSIAGSGTRRLVLVIDPARGAPVPQN